MASAISANSQSPSESSFYPEDIVKFTQDGQEKFAVVTRCWIDEVSPEIIAQAHARGIEYTPLENGQLEVLLPGGQQNVIKEVDAVVVDRGFLVADACRKVGGKGQAGTITKIDVQVRIMHTLSQMPISGWFHSDDFVGAIAFSRGDHVVFEDWVGIVEETLEVGVVQIKGSGGKMDLRRVCDVGSTSKLVVGASSANFFLDTPIAPTIPESTDMQRIIDTRQMLVAVNWLCTNQRGDVSSFERPKRLWVELNDLKLVRAAADRLHSVGDNVRFRDTAALVGDLGFSQPEPGTWLHAFVEGHRVFTVTQTKSEVTVLWQDGTTSVGPSHGYEHCVNVDPEVDVFPGDIGMFTAADPPRIAVIQAMNSKKRVIDLRWYEEGLNGSVETVSGLEFDQHGPPPEVYGVKRQEIVLVTKEGATNAHEIPTVPRLGESEVATGNFPDAETLRHQMATLGMELDRQLEWDKSAVPDRSKGRLKSINWYGIVSDLLLDGRVVVQYPSGDTETLPLDRLYLLDDGLGPDGHHHDDDGMSVDQDSQDSWQTDSDADAIGQSKVEDVDGQEDGDSPRGKQDVEQEKARGWAEETADADATAEVSMPAETEDEENWKRFEVLEDAPEGHHYYTQPTVKPTKSYMARIAKEHAVLASSLPPNILVRAYEDRSDLLRCLIIGPLGTPFANAPFLFDIFLSPIKFPTEPPQVFFHSWSGNTRVSPNLYAEGKVCLSLLNTWEGDATESWSSARSSVLQVVVSIQGLIMTEKPYYTEPGFEKQMSTLEGETASDLYNERTFVLTRAFVLRAVTSTPAPDFQNEIRAYYRTGLATTEVGALPSIIDQARRLLAESAEYYQRESEMQQGEEEGMDQDNPTRNPPSKVVPGLCVLTEGAALSLKRTLNSLDAAVKQ